MGAGDVSAFAQVLANRPEMPSEAVWTRSACWMGAIDEESVPKRWALEWELLYEARAASASFTVTSTFPDPEA